ncbi:Uncharacterised protein [Gemella morbillorum]|jgi:hypothetical protein|uniref:Uncharacterized protein n=1 Tax=Gemella morbillorum TaxID=29391 RepID=A0A2X4NHK4_9BACL|nr:hypothetical protein [Gemella morbillorum]EFV34853.1 hypothetical protein HMPREF0432_01506 [Gemella morbillorum M424]MBF1209165.1 hypothetical protein [Gemella morbillorum]MBF1212657.1 hypothetical protein [Gemella morbillorum]MDK8239942.1 hypothetical protein [Gemella morbillorum]MDK8254364.1 hypothetical protein [Gemella morbillorum]
MNWFEITLIDGTRGLLNLDNVVDIWKGLDDDYATISQVNDEELEVPASEYDRLKRALDLKGYTLGGF